MEATVQIFLSYAREDEKEVKKLYQKLSDAGLEPWMDKKDLLPGERWKSRIRQAIKGSDFFLACLSANSVSKRGFLQKEIRDALSLWEEMLDSDIYLIPVRLEDCEVPERLCDFQWVNLFEDDGWMRLMQAIQAGIERRMPVTGPSIEVTLPDKQETMPDALLKLQCDRHIIFHRINESITLIGRAKKCQLEVPDDYDNVERYHATIFYKEDVFTIADGYQNRPTRFGTFVNGVKVRPQTRMPLRNGDRIVLGGFRKKEAYELSRGACEIIFERRS